MATPQKFHMIGSLDQTSSDANREARSIPYGFVKLVNAVTNRRPGAAIVRGGSLTELTGAYPRVLGIGVYKRDTPAALQPVDVKLLANITAKSWQVKDGAAWAATGVYANTDHSTTKQTQFAQISSVLAIAGGRPSRWDPDSAIVERMGHVPPTAAITYVSAAGSLSPLIGYQWMYTFATAATGKESDWSPLSTSTGAQTSKQFTLTLPTTAPGTNADQIRIYRLADGGSVFRYVASVTLGTSSYVDNTADAALGDAAPEQGDNALPPSQSFIVQKFAERFVFNDVDNPSQLALSKPFTGNPYELEYFPTTSKLSFQHEITGTFVTTAGMLVFGVREITLLTGSDFDTFRADPLKFGVGTQFANSIAGNGDTVVFLGENGFKQLSGGNVRHISQPIDDELRAILSDNYNQTIYVSASYNPAMDQFIFALSMSATSNTAWVMSDSGSSLALWELVSGGALESWDVPSQPVIDAALRVKIWGWCPTTDEWCEYQFPQVPDNNANGKLVMCLCTPPPSAGLFEPFQDITYMGIGIYGSLAGGIIVGAWSEKYDDDDGSPIEALAITSRLVPGRDDDAYKRYRHLTVSGDYSDISAHGGTVKYLADFDDPQDRSYTPELKLFSGSGDKRVFTEGKARFVHLVFGTQVGTSGDILCENFTIWFNELKVREGR